MAPEFHASHFIIFRKNGKGKLINEESQKELRQLH